MQLPSALWLDPVIIYWFWVVLTVFAVMLLTHAAFVAYRTYREGFRRSAGMGLAAALLSLINLVFCVRSVLPAHETSQRYESAVKQGFKAMQHYQEFNPWGHGAFWLVLVLALVSIVLVLRAIKLTFDEGDPSSTFFPKDTRYSEFGETRY